MEIETKWGWDFDLVAGNSLEAPEFLAEIRQSNGVMQDPVGAEVVRVGSTDDADHRKVLTVRAGDCVDHTQAAHCERHHASADAPAPCVAVGGVAGIEFVATSDVGEFGLRNEVVEEGEVKVTGDGENVCDPNLDEAAREVAAEGGLGGGDGCGGEGVLDGWSGAVGDIADVVVGGLSRVEGADAVHGFVWVWWG